MGQPLTDYQRELLKQIVPGTMLARLFEVLAKRDGHVIRDDLSYAVNAGSVAPLAGYIETDVLGATRVAREAWDICDALFPELGAGSCRMAVLGACMAILKLAEEGFIDAGSSPSLTAAAIVSEAQEDPEAGWEWSDIQVQKVSNNIVNGLFLRGVY